VIDLLIERQFIQVVYRKNINAPHLERQIVTLRKGGSR
jgi:hypothetical protein